MADLLKLLKNVRKNGTGWTALCPSHDDKENSLSISRGDGKWLLTCFADCALENITAAVGLRVADLFDVAADRGEGVLTPPATVQPCNRPLGPA
jgi:hypothetical protein